MSAPNPYDEKNVSWSQERIVPPRRVVALRGAVGAIAVTALVVGGAAVLARNPAGAAQSSGPAPAVTVTQAGPTVQVTVSAVPTPTPTKTGRPAKRPERADQPGSSTTTSKPKPKPKPTSTKTTSQPKASTSKPRILSLSCTRSDLKLIASAKVSTGGKSGTLIWVMDGETMSRSVSAATTSASANMGLLKAAPATCSLTIKTAAGTASASRRSN